MPTTKWTIDPGHSGIHFSVRHLVIAKVRGKFTKFEGTIELDEADLTGPRSTFRSMSPASTRPRTHVTPTCGLATSSMPRSFRPRPSKARR
jgi:YceI-like domain